jgi:hypothetical protein
MKKTLGIVFTTISWWVCVLCAKYLSGTLQISILALFVILSLVFHLKYYVRDLKKFLPFYILALGVGLLADGTLLYTEHYSFTGTTVFYFPSWLLALWLVFPLNFLHTFQKFLEKPWLCFIFGALGGPLAYKAGPAFGILGLSDQVLYLIAVYWAFYMFGASLFKGKTGSVFET